MGHDSEGFTVLLYGTASPEPVATAWERLGELDLGD
jgi:hypothetical protein